MDVRYQGNTETGKYQVIYADCPWAYRNKKTGGSLKSGAQAHYTTMSLPDLLALPIKDIADKNSVLFLWATVPLLPEAMQVMAGWGFKYKTMLTWRKIMSNGMGFWFRGQTEHLLFGVRGQVKAFRFQRANFHESKCERHSKKPDYFRELISSAVEKSLPGARKIELFARLESAGWSVFGNEVENSITL